MCYSDSIKTRKDETQVYYCKVLIPCVMPYSIQHYLKADYNVLNIYNI